MMEKILIYIAALLIAVILGVVIGTLINYLRESHEQEEAPVYTQAAYVPGWSLEFWDIGQGICLQARFYGGLTLGRGEPGRYYADIYAIGRSLTISKEQCVIYDQGGRLMLWNLSEINPTLLNGNELERPEVLQRGDRLAMGGSVYLVTAIEQV